MLNLRRAGVSAGRGRFFFSVLSLVAVVFAAGCFRPPSPAPAPAMTPAALPPETADALTAPGGLTLREFQERYRLRLTAADADRYIFALDGAGAPADSRILVIYPRIASINFADTAQTMPAAPGWRGGALYFPASFIAALPAPVRERQHAAVPTAAPRPKRLIIIDAGHGGRDDGASANGLKEKDVNLDIARRLQTVLAARGQRTALTRDRDVFLSLDERSRIANRSSGAIFISLHQNAAGAGVSGVETFWISGTVSDDARAGSAAARYAFIGPKGRLSPQESASKAKEIVQKMRLDSQRLAQAVHNRLVLDLGENDRGVKQANFAVLRENFFGTAVLVETGFLTNRATARRLAVPAYRQKIAESLAAALIQFLNQ